MKDQKIKLVYLMGFGRSGGTLLGRIIGNNNNSIYTGELRHIWHYGFIKNYLCTCGNNFRDCEFWRNVAKEYKALEYLGDPEKLYKDFGKFENLKNYFKLKKFYKVQFDKNFKKRLNRYLMINENIYETIAKLSGKNVLIESSRIPGRLFALSFSTKFDIYVIYLIRDPRGVLNSLINHEIRSFGRQKNNNLKRMLPWIANSIFSLIILRKLFKINRIYINYEEFVRNPGELLKKLEKFLDFRFYHEEENGKVSIYLKPGHVFAANEGRFKTGPTIIDEDTKWKQQLSRGNKFITSITMLPLYKYIVKRYC